jgi:hypothetical protein
MPTEALLGHGLASIPILEKLAEIAGNAVNLRWDKLQNMALRTETVRQDSAKGGQAATWADPECQQMAQEVDEEILKYCVWYDLMYGLEREVWEATKQGRISDFQALGDTLHLHFDSVIALLHRYRGRVVGRLEDLGFGMRNAPQLDRTIQELERIKADLLGNWPLFTPEDIGDCLPQEASGEMLDLDDAFTDITGLDKDTLRQKAKERKRSGGLGPMGSP